jgi:hypothetical protein
MNKYIDPSVVYKILRSAPALVNSFSFFSYVKVWMAEYNNNCVEKIKQKIRQLPLGTIPVVQQFLENNNKMELNQCFKNWDLPNWFNTSDLGSTLWGYF